MGFVSRLNDLLARGLGCLLTKPKTTILIQIASILWYFLIKKFEIIIQQCLKFRLQVPATFLG